MSVLWLLLLLGSVVNVLTNAWRHGNIDLTGKDANMRGVYARSTTIGIAICALMRVNLIDILHSPAGASAFIGWLDSPWNASAPLASQILFVFEQIVGIAVTGVVVAFAAKFWNDSFDILYEFKRWLRGNANAMKPEPRTRTRTRPDSRPDTRPRSDNRRSRPPRRRGGGSGSSEGGVDSRPPREPRDSRD